MQFTVNTLSEGVSILISVMDKTRVESQERSGWVLRKPYAPAFGFIKHLAFFEITRNQNNTFTRKNIDRVVLLDFTSLSSQIDNTRAFC